MDRAFRNDPRIIRDLVIALQDKIQACEARQHPYGFTVVTLGIIPGRHRIVYRLHIWPIGFALPGSEDLMIHDHVYDIQSHILAGQIVQHEYVESALGAEFASYRGLYDGPHSVLERKPGAVRVFETAVSTFVTGHTYALPAGALHMAKVDPSVFTATILRTDYREREGDPVILAPIDAPPSFRFERDLVGDDAIAATISALFRELTCARSI
ncbi:hypothetical protein SAMN03159338_4070 [Sphingomonas sp. NFR04]|nr:hypothetical protein SAMN03159338_4070 [Sphingomonas sp. NFR04]